MKLRINKPLIYILLLFLITRAILCLIGVSSRIILEDYHGDQYQWKYSNHLALDIWGVWDSGYYLDIAREGYSSELGSSSMTMNQANYAFFPLYPMLTYGLGKILGNYFIAGIIISNLAMLIGMYFLFKLTTRLYSEETAYKSVKYAFLFPSAFIFSGVFSEALFFMLLVITFYYAQQKHWLATGIIGFFLALSRPIGVFMFIPLLYLSINEWLKQRKNNPDNKPIFNFKYLALFLLPAGIGLFFVYIHAITGNIWAYLNVQQVGWGHVLSNPFSVAMGSLLSGDIFHFINGLWVILVAIILITGYKKINPTYLMVGVLLILVPLSSGTVSLNSMLRYLLPIFPLYLILARMTKNPHLDLAVTIVLAIFQGFLMVFWSNGFPLLV